MSDLIARVGPLCKEDRHGDRTDPAQIHCDDHDPLPSCGEIRLQKQIRQKIKDPEIDSPPMNITEEDPIKGLKYAAIEVPSGVRGRMSIIGPLIDEAEAAIVVDNAPYGFGCIGCARTNELSIFLLRNKDIPVLELTYPTNQDETYVMVNKINEFVDSLEQTAEEE